MSRSCPDSGTRVPLFGLLRRRKRLIWATLTSHFSFSLAVGLLVCVRAKSKGCGSIWEAIQATGKCILSLCFGIFITTICMCIFFCKFVHFLFIFLQHSWLNQGQQGRGKGRGRMFPLEMPLFSQFHQGLQVFPLLQVGLQQQLQMLREDFLLKVTNILCGNMSQESKGTQQGEGRRQCELEMQLLPQYFQEHIFPCERSFVGFTSLWNWSLHKCAFTKEKKC